MKRFTLKEGISDKFWEIDLQANSYTIHYGRSGAAGVVKTKEFDSKDKARTEYNKQINSKLKKGYSEEGESTNSLQAQPIDNFLLKPKNKVKPEPVKKENISNQNSIMTTSYSNEPVTLGLTCADFRWVTWRDQETSTIPPALPYDHDKLLKTYTNIRIIKANYWLKYDWRTADMPLRMSQQEACFWLKAMSPERATIPEMKKMLKETDFSQFNYQKIIETVDFSTPWVMIPIFNLLDEGDLIDLILTEKQTHHRGSDLSWTYVRGLQYILPLLSNNATDKLTAQAIEKICPENWPSDFHCTTNYFVLGATLGLSDALKETIESWDDKLYSAGDDWHDHYHKPQEVIFGLDDPEQINYHLRRLKLPLSSPDYIRAWLAHTDTRYLDWIEYSVGRESNRELAEFQMTALTGITASDIAPFMLSLTKNSKAPKPAKEWLEQHPQETIIGLTNYCISARTRDRQETITTLRLLKRKGYADLFLQVADNEPSLAEFINEIIQYQDPADNPLNEADTPDWLINGLHLDAKVKPITWVSATELPAIVMGNHALNLSQTNQLIQVLKVANDELPEFCSTLADNVDHNSLNDFAWSLFEAWLSEGAPAKEKWAMTAMGYLGGDPCVMKLTPLIRKWPGESQHQRAVTGLEVLRLIGSKTALMQLSGISQKVKFKGIKNKAQEYMEFIAKEKGITKSELEDMVIPDCGLDERGQRVFDFGSRKFHFVLGQELKPKVKDDNGKLRDNLPKPAVKDDAELADKALKDWKLIKKQIRDVTKIQAERLELAMVVSRRWRVSDYDALIAKHPLMTHLARTLLWGGYKGGELVSSFRLTEEQDFSDANDNPIKIGNFDEIGIMHPLNTPEEDKNAWGEVFSDYELIPPFQQLGRPVFTLEGDEPTKQSMLRFEGLVFPAPSLIFGLEKMGWSRGEAMDAGSFDEHSKQFPTANVTAVVGYEGAVGMGFIDPDESLTTTDIVFIEGMRAPSGYGSNKKGNMIPLKHVDPLVISEVIKDLNQMAAKAQ